MDDILIDSSVLISFLKKELDHRSYETLEGRKGAISILTFTETCKYFHAAGKAREWNEQRAKFSSLETLPVTKQIGELAAKTCVEKNLPLIDAIIYATAVEHKLILVTKDDHFHGLKNVLMIK